jgi:hypothetical protein
VEYSPSCLFAIESSYCPTNRVVSISSRSCTLN